MNVFVGYNTQDAIVAIRPLLTSETIVSYPPKIDVPMDKAMEK